MVAEGKSYVQKLQMAVSLLAGIVQGFPYSQYARVLQGVGFAHAARKPKVSIVARVDTGTTTDNLIFVSDDKDAALPLRVGSL